jgi:diguanylate cyclase (GGDEF)-like protein
VLETWGTIAVVAVLALLGACVWLGAQVTQLRGRLKDVAGVLDTRTTDLERARLQIQRLSSEDDLTALGNHEQLLEFLQREWRRARREASPLSLIVADIDDFRAYNRQYGRRAGDECLKEIGGALAKLARRPGDLVARYHRDQFAVALAATEASGANAIAERVRRAVEMIGVPAAKDASAVVVTVSVGVSTVVPPRESALEELDLIKAARHALRHARDSGGNRVSHAGVGEPTVRRPERVSSA